MTHDHWMALALLEAEKAREAGEVPVGAVVVAADRLIGRGFNRPISASDPTAHAEIVALRDASQAEGNYRLTGATLYVTTEPCLMCVGAMVHARIGLVVYGAAEPKSGAIVSTIRAHESPGLNHRLDALGGIMEDECRRAIQTFFKERRGVERQPPEEIRARFIKAAVWHGNLNEAQALLTEHPDIAGSDIYTAALLGDEARVRDFIARDSTSATAKGAPLQWDALTHLCFSKYLRLDRSRSDGFINAARALLDAGASANTGFFEATHQPKPEWESVLYAAAGVAHHAALTRLLLEHGADPNDAEVPYHSPETSDNTVIEALLDSGKLTDDSLSTMLLRKADWHDYDGLKLLLERGADPNRMTHWGHTALHQALRRDNHVDNIALLLDHGADPAMPNRLEGQSAISIAVWRGRRDALELLEQRRVPIALDGVERLVAACARGNDEMVRSIAADQPEVVRRLVLKGGTALAQFAGVGNTDGVACLLNLGIFVDRRYAEGDGYFGVAANSTALHVAAWRARPATVKLLIARGANVNAVDGRGRTPLVLAVRACVDSYWTERRTPESVEALLQAGASLYGVKVPSGYDEVDRLLEKHKR